MQNLENIPWLEVLASSFSIVYSLLLMKEKILGWVFGIASSVLSMILFFETKLYAQALISIYYAGIGVYGWLYWKKALARNEHIRIWKPAMHTKAIFIFSAISIASSLALQYYTDSPRPYLDSFLTVFGFLASIKEARKILTSWVYWFVINVLSAWLYFGQGLTIYAALMLVYAVICVPGYLSWLKIYKENKPIST